MIRVKEIVDAVKSNPIYSWELRELGCVEFIGMVEDLDGDRIWYKNGEYHRLDGPAIEFSNRTKEWYKEGKLHREDGPAVENPNGYSYWYQNGSFYRNSGPILEWLFKENSFV